MKLSRLLCATALLSVTLGTAHAATIADAKDDYTGFESPEFDPFVPADAGGAPRETGAFSTSNPVFASFQGISQYDVAAYHRNFIPPDTMGAVGTTQYTTFANGGFAVFDKATGATVAASSDLAFWSAAGQTGANGDSRVMFDAAQNRWVALSFGNDVADIQIAVSDTANAAGAWHSTIFTGFANGVADYPTMAIDANGLYIGTNDFGFDPQGNAHYLGSTLNVLPLASLFAAGGPSTNNLAQFYTPCNASTCEDRGFAIQGVNTTGNAGTGKVISASLLYNDTLTYNVNFTSGVATSTSSVTYLGTQDYGSNDPARQPNQVPDAIVAASTFPNNNQVVDTLDQRISAAVYEKNGKIYSVYTATDLGSDHTAVRYVVTDAATNTVLDQGEIGDATHDYYQGSIAVNDKGEVMIAYDRSGSDPSDGKITFAGERFTTGADGKLHMVGSELVFKVSLVDDYHNGTLDGQVAGGRQRWGDYSAVNVDPTNEDYFWAIGEYAREYNDAAGGHPGGTGGSRWSTWIVGVNFNVDLPEPSTWAMMLLGVGAIGASMRRQRRVRLSYAMG